MVASKTSFVIAAVALGAATSVYAAPVQYNGGADLAARGFEDEDFQLAARFFDDELEFEARDFDEEEYLFARERKPSNAFAADDNDDYPPPPSHGSKHDGKGVSGNGLPKDRHTSSSLRHSTSSSGSPAGLSGHRVLAANNGIPREGAASKDGEHKHHHKHHHRKGQDKHHLKGQEKYHPKAQDIHRLQDNSHAAGQAARLDKLQHKSAAGHTVPDPTHHRTGSESGLHSTSGFNRKLSSGSTDHATGSTKTNKFKDNEDDDDDYETPVRHTKSSAQKSIKQRDFDEEDAILLARSLGLDDDYFLEARSFDDDMYEYY